MYKVPLSFYVQHQRCLFGRRTQSSIQIAIPTVLYIFRTCFPLGQHFDVVLLPGNTPVARHRPLGTVYDSPIGIYFLGCHINGNLLWESACF